MVNHLKSTISSLFIKTKHPHNFARNTARPQSVNFAQTVPPSTCELCPWEMQLVLLLPVRPLPPPPASSSGFLAIDPVGPVRTWEKDAESISISQWWNRSWRHSRQSWECQTKSQEKIFKTMWFHPMTQMGDTLVFSGFPKKKKKKKLYCRHACDCTQNAKPMLGGVGWCWVLALPPDEIYYCSILVEKVHLKWVFCSGSFVQDESQESIDWMTKQQSLQ